jgi:hypothetical protein
VIGIPLIFALHPRGLAAFADMNGGALWSEYALWLYVCETFGFPVWIFRGQLQYWGERERDCKACTWTASSKREGQRLMPGFADRNHPRIGWCA